LRDCLSTLPKPILPEGGVDTHNIHNSMSTTPLKYMHTVRMAAIRDYSLGWVNYDEQYRLRKATSPSSSWGVVDMELWMLCVSTPPSGIGGELRDCLSILPKPILPDATGAVQYNISMQFKVPRENVLVY
jgi:hypothetical protein